MKVFAVVLALSLVLSAAPGFAQAQAPAPAQPKTAAPVAPSPAPATQKPATPAEAQPPAAKVVPFQAGLKYAFVDLGVVAQSSAQGKAFNSKVEALQAQKVKELQDKDKALTAAQEKLEKGATVLNDQARAGLQTEIEKMQRDIQRYTEDAQQEIQSLTQQLQQQFYAVLTPVINQVAMDKQVHFIFDAAQSGLVWAEPSMNLTADVVKALDASTTAKPAPAAAPAIGPAVPVQK